MPDPFGRLTDDERQRIADFINEKSKSLDDACLVCGHTDTRIGGGILMLPAGGVAGELGAVQPVVPVNCHNCGFIRFFHAEALGLVPPSIQTEEQ